MSERREAKGEAGPWVETRRRVIYGDTDAMGVVYYGTYLRFLEVGRCELLRARARPYREIEAEGLLFPVTEVNLRYYVPARYDDELLIATRVEELGKATLRFGYELRRDDVVLAAGWTRHACVQRERLRPTRIPADLVSALKG